MGLNMQSAEHCCEMHSQIPPSSVKSEPLIIGKIYQRKDDTLFLHW